MFKKFTISLPEELYILIDKNRGNIPRSTYIQKLCIKSLKELGNKLKW
jgi:metal-responsive CopG/Arc/MetJ family transcriptional regulator